MRRGRVADDRPMETSADQPWTVFTRRPAPLAGLFWSESERMRAQDDDCLKEGERPLVDVGKEPVAPLTLD
jgi:hypothetical protein